jgi:hypothetical protein
LSRRLVALCRGRSTSGLGRWARTGLAGAEPRESPGARGTGRVSATGRVRACVVGRDVFWGGRVQTAPASVGARDAGEDAVDFCPDGELGVPTNTFQHHMRVRPVGDTEICTRDEHVKAAERAPDRKTTTGVVEPHEPRCSNFPKCSARTERARTAVHAGETESAKNVRLWVRVRNNCATPMSIFVRFDAAGLVFPAGSETPFRRARCPRIRWEARERDQCVPVRHVR